VSRIVAADARGITAAVDALRRGEVVGLPTETVYGLAADATNDDALRRVFAVKGRPADHPLIVHIADLEHARLWSKKWTTHAQVLADAFWPGPLTLILERAPHVIDQITGGRDSVAIRCPSHTLMQRVLVALDGGVAAPSANRFGKVSPTTAQHVMDDVGLEVDHVLDGGPCDIGVESTIVDCTGDEPVVLRVGAVTVERLAEILGTTPRVRTDDDSTGGARAPGMLASHYAPDARVHMAEADDVRAVLAHLVAADDGTVGLLAPTSMDDLPDAVVELEPVGPPDDYATALYARLRQADRLGLAHLVCVPPPPVGVGVAVRDRLRRAATR